MAKGNKNEESQDDLRLKVDGHLTDPDEHHHENLLVNIDNSGGHYWDPYRQYNSVVLEHGVGVYYDKKEEAESEKMKRLAFCANMEMICNVADDLREDMIDYSREVQANSWEDMVESNPHIYKDDGFTCGITDGYAEYLYGTEGIDGPKDSTDYLIEDLMADEPLSTSYTSLSPTLGSYDLIDILSEPQSDPMTSPVIVNNIDLAGIFGSSANTPLTTDSIALKQSTELGSTAPTEPAATTTPEDISSTGYTPAAAAMALTP